MIHILIVEEIPRYLAQNSSTKSCTQIQQRKGKHTINTNQGLGYLETLNQHRTNPSSLASKPYSHDHFARGTLALQLHTRSHLIYAHHPHVADTAAQAQTAHSYSHNPADYTYTFAAAPTYRFPFPFALRALLASLP
jgi:hypothetical protein